MAQRSAGSPNDKFPSEGDRTSPSLEGAIGSVPLLQRVSFVSKRGKRTTRHWRGRLKSRCTVYSQLYESLPPRPAIFSSRGLYGKQEYHSHERILQGPCGGLAHIDLQGRLLNADTATSLERVGGKLGDAESVVWKVLCPLQRVLVVAVVAAAASGAKATNADEVRRLQRVIHKRESVLMLMREELNNLLGQVDLQRSQLELIKESPSPSDSLDELVDLFTKIDVLQPCEFTLEKQDTEVTNCINESNEYTPSNVDRRDSEFGLSPAVNRQLNFSDLTKGISPIEESPIPRGPGEELMEKILSDSWIDQLDMGLLLEDQPAGKDCQCPGQQSVNDVVCEKSDSRPTAFERRLESESTVQPTEDLRQHFGTWEIGSNSVADTIQDNTGALEWMSETSSVVMDPFSPMPAEKQHGNRSQGDHEGVKDLWPKSEAEEKSFASRARCARILLDVQKRVLALLDEAASNLLDSLTFISEKAGQLEGPETDALTPMKPEEAWSKKSQASLSIKQNVTKASSKIAALQGAMVQLWDTLGPEAMTSLDIKPSDFEDYLTNLEIAKILNDDATELSTGTVSLESWQEWFRRGFDNPESSFLRKIQVSATNVSDNSAQEPLSDWPPSGSIYAGRRLKKEEVSPVGAAVRQKIEKLMLPLFERAQAEGGESAQQQSTDLATISEVLVAEFEKSAAKVSSLKKYVKVCDVKRKQVERKLLEAWEQDSKNQVKSGNEITELKRQVCLKEAAYQQLITTRKALVSAKTKEIQELREESRRHNSTLQDMASAAKATKDSSEKRLAMLEEICRKKDNSIMSLKQEIHELEHKVQELQVCQTPAELRPMNLPPAERDTESESTDILFYNENYRMFGDECQIRGSYQSMCGSENRRTSWGSDLSAQEFNIIDTPWSSDFTGSQDFIEEAAFKGRSLSIFQNVNSSQEFFLESLRKLDTTPGGGLDVGDGPGCSNSGQDPESRPTENPHREARRDSNNIPNHRKELSKSVMNMSLVTSRSKKRGDRLRASTGVLSAVGPNTPFKPRRPTSGNKERSQSSFNPSLKNYNPKENSNRSRQKWV